MVREGRVPARRPPPQVCPPRQVCTFHGGQPTPSPPATPTPSLLNLPDQVPALPESTPTGVSTLRSHPRGVALARCPVHDAAVLVLSCGPRNPVLPGMVPGSGLLGTHGGGLGGAGAPPPAPPSSLSYPGPRPCTVPESKGFAVPPAPPPSAVSHPEPPPCPVPERNGSSEPPHPPARPCLGVCPSGDIPEARGPPSDRSARTRENTHRRAGFFPGLLLLGHTGFSSPSWGLRGTGPEAPARPGPPQRGAGPAGAGGPSGRVAWGGR